MKRSKHSLSHYKLATFDMGELVPVALQEVLPGDTFQQATSALVRVSPLLAPVMHPVRVRIHHWFVPTRQIWTGFETFITGGPTGNDATVPPHIENFTPAEGSLADYFGLPVGVNLGDISALPFRAYSKIWNLFYRDQDLQTELTIDTGSGHDTTTNTALQNVTWEKDYFTLARPWTQKGTAVSMPLGTIAPVKYDNATSGSATPNDQFVEARMASGSGTFRYAATYGGAGNINPDGTWPMYADLSAATAATILDLRENFALQKFAENRAKFGSRYTEYLRSLGVRSRDGRPDQPIYLGGGKQTIQFSEVLQTGTNFGDNNGVGSMKGHGMGAVRSNRYRRFFEEHGYIITLMSVMPKTMYCQGVEKHWKRTVNEEYFQKELQDIGQAEVFNREIYAAHASPNSVFGYQDRYDEYRRAESKIAGEFRSTLNYWHLARIFASDPALNASFVSANPTKRMLASQSTDALYVMINHSIQARRPVRR